MKIFCIGLNKTGTTSIIEALKIIGYSNLCRPDIGLDLKIHDINCMFRLKKEELFKVIDQYDAFKDRPFNIGEHYKAIDENYPGSKFILTVREENSWMDSIERWLKVYPDRIDIYKRHFETDTYSKETFVQYYRTYTNGVRSYFKGRDCFLEMDICRGDGWGLLCPFLKRPVIDIEFPISNVNKLC